jgi:hypothetical protein
MLSLIILREVPVSNCSPKSVHVPTQELLHRKKCLLPDQSPSNVNTKTMKIFTKSFLGPSYGAPPAEEAQPAYTAPAPTYEG